MSKVFKVFKFISLDKKTSLTDSKAKIEYEVGEEARPKAGEGPMFAFEDYETARAFLLCGDELWECTAENVRPCRWRVSEEKNSKLRRLFWERLAPEEYNEKLRPKSLGDLEYYRERGDVCRTPEGTVACDVLIPLIQIG